MLGRSHLAIGAAAGEAVAFLLGGGGIGHLAIGGAIGAVSAWLPDIDSAASGISHAVPLGWLPGLILKHRGITHTLLAATGWYLLWAAWASPRFGLPSWWALAAAAGYASHLALDLVSGGVPLLWPVKRARIGPLWVQTGSILEHAAIFPTTLALWLLVSWRSV